MLATLETSLVTKKAGTLTIGDEFRFKLAGDEGRFSVFSFHGHVTPVRGEEYVNCYGGDADPRGRRQWHSLSAERVAATAMKPGRMARAKRPPAS